jgi:hypothetical protein
VLTVKFLTGAYPQNTASVFTLTKFRTPTDGQAALANIVAGTSNDLSAVGGPIVIDTTSTGAFPAISWLTGLVITLTSSVKATATTATVSFTPTQAITAGANAGIIITLSGAGIALDTTAGAASACAVTAPAGASCSAALASSKLTVKLTAGTFNAATAITFTITKFTNPTDGQAALANIAAGTSNDLSAVGGPIVIDTTSTGSFSTIYTASVTLSTIVAAATNVTAIVAFTPASSAYFKTIAVAGTNFVTSAVTSSTTCTLNGTTSAGSATVTWSGTILVITLTTAFAGTSSTAISCPVAGLTNAATAQAAKTVSITTLDGATTPAVIDQVTGVAFSAIGQNTAVTFTIAAGDRVAAKASVAVTLMFTTKAALATNGKITLNYPAGFFAGTPNPAANAAGSTSVSNMTATSAISANSIVITTAVVGIAATTAFTITLSGLTMGAVTVGSATGITVQTDADTVASAGVASGGIFTQTTAVTLTPSLSPTIQITLSPSTARLDPLNVTLTTLAPNFNGSSQCRIFLDYLELLPP